MITWAWRPREREESRMMGALVWMNVGHSIIENCRELQKKEMVWGRW